MKLEGKVAVITGSATGIGKATAELFAKEGAKVVVADVNDEKGNETIERINSDGGEAIYTHVNVSKVEDIERMFQITIDNYGKLDVFFSNAGIPGPGFIETTEEAAYDFAQSINLKAGFFGAKYAIPLLKQSGGGSILYTCSGSAIHPSLSSTSYSVFKAGILMLTKSLALTEGKHNIRVNSICPGPITTTLFWPKSISRNAAVDTEALTKTIVSGVPLGRATMPEEIAQAALFLVSDEGSFISGIAFPVDGGESAK